MGMTELLRERNRRGEGGRLRADILAGATRLLEQTGSEEAVTLRASDIHIEPFADRVRIRYRIDGVLMERDNAPRRLLGAIVSRIKIMGFIDITRDGNPGLLDQTNREGLVHNHAVEDLRRLLYFVLQVLEAERQSVRHPIRRGYPSASAPEAGTSTPSARCTSWTL